MKSNPLQRARGAVSASIAAILLASIAASPLRSVALAASNTTTAGKCSNWSERFNQSIEGVCVCTAADCDTVSNGYLSLGANEVGVYQTSKAGDRLAYSTIAVASDASAATADIVLDTTVRYQTIVGFGGAFTDAAAINVYKLTPALQQKLVDAYYAESGLQYTLGRIPIASSDFSTSIYSYNPVADDLAMEHFSIDVDKAPASHKLDLIKRALATTKRELKLFGSSWAPPSWMAEGNTTINAKLKGAPGGPYWKALALYYSKFVSAYEAEGVPLWGMTVQNEPIQQIGAPLEWQSLRFSGADERDFIKNDLGPLLKQSHSDLKLIIFDDQKDEILNWNASLIDPEAKQYVAGIGVHWYKNLDFVTESLGAFDKLKAFYALYPNVFILATEACEGYLIKGLGTGVGVRLLEPDIVWKRGEIYARDIINDLAAFASGWTDWNLVLDTTGGPGWTKNRVDAPILIDEAGGHEFYKQPMYYVMGHFSKFLLPGSQQIALNVSESSLASLAKVDRVAFVTPDKQLAVVLQNRDATPKTLTISLAHEQRHFEVVLPGNSVQTLLISTIAGSSSSSATKDASTPMPASATSSVVRWCWRWCSSALVALAIALQV